MSELSKGSSNPACVLASAEAVLPAEVHRGAELFDCLLRVLVVASCFPRTTRSWTSAASELCARPRPAVSSSTCFVSAPRCKAISEVRETVQENQDP